MNYILKNINHNNYNNNVLINASLVLFTIGPIKNMQRKFKHIKIISLQVPVHVGN